MLGVPGNGPGEGFGPGPGSGIGVGGSGIVGPGVMGVGSGGSTATGPENDPLIRVFCSVLMGGGVSRSASIGVPELAPFAEGRGIFDRVDKTPRFGNSIPRPDSRVACAVFAGMRADRTSTNGEGPIPGAFAVDEQ